MIATSGADENVQCQKRFQMVCFQGLDPGEMGFKIFRFGYEKAANDKKVPDRVGSGLIFLFRFLLVFLRAARVGSGYCGNHVRSPRRHGIAVASSCS